VRPVYHPEFKASFDAALRHYQEIGLPLGDRFKTEVRAGVGLVISGTVNHAPGPHGFRCYRCKKFPYLIYYERAGEVVLFLAVLYAGRDSALLKETLQRYRDEGTAR
jgi:hypothetical protein